MAGATDVRSGMQVRTPHGTKLGRVTGVEGGMMKVRRGTLLSRELDVPIEDIEAVEGDEVIVSAAAAELHFGRRYSLKDRPKLHLRERAAAAGDPRLSGSSAGSVTVEQDTVVVSDPGNGTRVAYRESLIGVSDDEAAVRTWVVESPLLSQSLDVEQETATDDESEEDSDRDEQRTIEPSQAEHPG